MGAILYAAFGGENLHNRASPEGKQADLASLEVMHSPFGGWRHHLSPTSWWDYGYLAMEPCLCRKA